MLTGTPAVLRKRERADYLRTVDVALLAVEERAALPLRRIDHHAFRWGIDLLIDFEQPRRDRRFEDHPIAEDQPVDRSRGKALLRELRGGFGRTECRQRGIGDPARKIDDAPGQCMT